MKYETFKVQQLDNGHIIKVSINRPKALNAMNSKFFQEIGTIFKSINQQQNARVAILTAQGRAFCAGLDLKQYGPMFNWDETMQPARTGIKLYQGVRYMQRQLLSVLECRVPVLIGIHNLCVGGGVDLITMGDIRYCTEDTKMTVKEVDIGMAADLGSLQFLPNIIGNQSTFRQLAYTGRVLESKQAKEIGLVGKVFNNKQKMEQGLLETARVIASKSPAAIYAIKTVVRRQMSKKVSEGLQYVARMNTSMLQTKDMSIAVSSWMSKVKPQFPKL